jgi:hypothetical protein
MPFTKTRKEARAFARLFARAARVNGLTIQLKRLRCRKLMDY